MRGRLAVMAMAPVSVATLALVGAGCSTGTRSTGQPVARQSTSVPATPVPSSTNTAQVCAAINQAVVSGTTAFGADAGTMVGHLAGGNPAAAAKSKVAATGRLTRLAGQIRAAVVPADSIRLRDAAQASARNLDTLATDPALFAGVKAKADLPRVLDRVSDTTNPLNQVCR